MGSGINIGYLNQDKGIAVAVTTVKGHKKPCLVVQKDNVFDVVATFRNELAAERFADAFKQFVYIEG